MATARKKSATTTQSVPISLRTQSSPQLKVRTAMRSAPRKQSGSAIFYILIGLILLALPMAYVAFLAPRPAPAALLQPANSKIPELKINDISGQVQIRRGNGEWAVAKKGESLKSSD